MPKPKKVYYLEVINGTGGKLRYGQRGGGHFTSLSAARDRRNIIFARGVESRLYETEVNWKEIDADE